MQLSEALELAMSEANRTDKKGKSHASDGKYKHDGGWERPCGTCGHTLGHHSGDKVDGKRPCFEGDFSDDSCECENFTASRKKK